MTILIELNGGKTHWSPHIAFCNKCINISIFRAKALHMQIYSSDDIAKQVLFCVVYKHARVIYTIEWYWIIK